MLRRFFILLTALFVGALAIEVLNYHTLATLAKDHWAIAPQLGSLLVLVAALLVLARASRASVRFFGICCAISIVVGLIGIGFHWASHGLSPATFGTTTSWLGEPPPLAPLEFAVVGLLGLIGIAWGGIETLEPQKTSVAAKACYGLGALAAAIGFASAGVSSLASADLADGAALTLGIIGYVIELAAT